MSKRLGITTSLFASLCVSASLFPAVALAQPEPEPEPEVEGEGDPAASGDGDKVELEENATPAEEETPYDFGTTGEENPGAPTSEFNKQEDEPAKAEKKKRVYDGYPTRVIDRPLTLPGGTSEVQLAIPAYVDPYAIGGTLRATYAVTSEVQLGLRYGLGAFTEDGDGFEVGKAVSLDTQYRFTDNISAQLSVPMYLDPFALGVVLGAPMKFTFFDSFSLLVGEDLVSIKVKEFFPSIDNARQNAVSIANMETGSTVPDWLVKASLRGIYQLDEKNALDAELGTRFDDSEAASTALLNLGLVRVQSQNLDLGARVIVDDLAHLVDTLGFNLFVNYRI